MVYVGDGVGDMAAFALLNQQGGVALRCSTVNRGQRAIASPRRRCYAGPTASRRTRNMPILVFLILIILIAQIGFWDTFTAILGGVAMIVLFVLLAIALVVVAGLLLVRRLRRRGQSLP